MIQDPYGQPPVTGNVVRGEVIPDDEGNVVPPTVPMTRFQKVASALRGDRTDPDIPVGTADGADPDGAGPDGTAGPQAGQTGPDAADGLGARDAADETSPEDFGAVRSPDAGDRDYWDDDLEETGPDQPADQAVPDAADADPAPTPPDRYSTAASDETPEPGPDAADAAADEATLPDDTDTPAAVPATVPATVLATGAAAAALRPGESDSTLADFSDLTFGSLLPDAAEFRVRWQEVQFRFVDDPRGSVTEAADVISELTAKLEAAIAEWQRAIAERQRALRERWGEGESADTESLRGTLLMYRAFLDQLTGPADR